MKIYFISILYSPSSKFVISSSIFTAMNEMIHKCRVNKHLDAGWRNAAVDIMMVLL